MSYLAYCHLQVIHPLHHLADPGLVHILDKRVVLLPESHGGPLSDNQPQNTWHLGSRCKGGPLTATEEVRSEVLISSAIWAILQVCRFAFSTSAWQGGSIRSGTHLELISLVTLFRVFFSICSRKNTLENTEEEKGRDKGGSDKRQAGDELSQAQDS